MLAKVSYLIIAHSGRALARSAWRAGLPVYVIDRFADQDTRRYALTLQAVPCRSNGGFSAAQLLGAIQRVLARDSHAQLVVGSVFEACPQLLERVTRGVKLVGNLPQVVRKVKDPVEFFGSLDRLGIAHPEILVRGRGGRSGWLMKRIGGTGGDHITWYDGVSNCRQGWYLQRYVVGETLSVVFLADGTEARVVGVSRLWHAPGSDAQPFKYGGAVALPAALPEQLRTDIVAVLEPLTRAFVLRGLCGADFILDECGRLRLLEVNPRPPATFELHDAGRGLFEQHVAACRGRLPQVLLRNAMPVRAHAVLYAWAAISLLDTWEWPAWTTDRPVSGTRIEAGQPVCTVHAQAGAPEQAARLLQGRLASLRADLDAVTRPSRVAVILKDVMPQRGPLITNKGQDLLCEDDGRRSIRAHRHFRDCLQQTNNRRDINP